MGKENKMDRNPNGQEPDRLYHVRPYRIAANRSARSKVMRQALIELKLKLPWVPPGTNMSKLNILEGATWYIEHLRQILTKDKPGSS